MLPIIAPIVAAIASIGRSWLDIRKVKAEGKISITQAKIQSKIKRYEQIGEMDITAMKGMQFSWKDEFLTILLSIPMVMCFVPVLADFALQGFAILTQTPEWYRWCFMGVVTATFGLRTWTGWKK